jgi:hypothetical protein
MIKTRWASTESILSITIIYFPDSVKSCLRRLTFFK